MNAALVGLVRDWMNDMDRQRDKKDERKYQEGRTKEQRQYEEGRTGEGRTYQEGQKKEGRAYEEGRTEEGRRYLEGQKASDRKYQEERAVISRQAALDDAAKLAQQNYDTLRLRFAASLPSLRLQFPGMTDDQIYNAVGGNPELTNISGNVTAKEGLTRGLPASGVRATLASNAATEALARKSQAENEALLPNAGRNAIAGQNLSFLNSVYGGQDPASALLNPNQRAFINVNPSGEIDVKMNPFFGRINPDPMSKFGPDAALIGAAEGLGMPQYDMKLNTSGNAVRPPQPQGPPDLRKPLSAAETPSQFEQIPGISRPVQWPTVRQGRGLTPQQFQDAQRETIAKQMLDLETNLKAGVKGRAPGAGYGSQTAWDNAYKELLRLRQNQQQ